MDALDDFRRGAMELIRELGGPVTYVHSVTNNPHDPDAPQGTYNPETGEYEPAAVIEFPLTGVLIDLTLKRDGMGVKPGTMIQDSDKVCHVVPSPMMIESLGPEGLFTENIAGDYLKVGPVTYRVYNIKSTDPRGTGAIVYELYLRR